MNTTMIFGFYKDGEFLGLVSNPLLWNELIL